MMGVDSSPGAGVCQLDGKSGEDGPCDTVTGWLEGEVLWADMMDGAHPQPAPDAGGLGEH